MNGIRQSLGKIPAWLASGATGLTGRLLLLTCIFVLIGETVIFVFSVGSYHRELLDDYILSAESAALPLTEIKKTKGWFDLRGGFRSAVMEKLDTNAVVLIWPDRNELIPTPKVPRQIDQYIDLRAGSTFKAIVEGFDCLLFGGDRTLYLRASPRFLDAERIDVAIDEAPLRKALIAYSGRIALFALIVTAMTAAPLLWCFHILLVAPMQAIIRGMERFRENPEDARRIFQPSSVQNEIGEAGRELTAMQKDLHQSLNRKARLAALGGAVARIQHDLRNMLASAQLISDRLTASDDPKVRKMAPNLIATIDRAGNLAANTLKYARSEQPPFHSSRFALADMIAEAAATAQTGAACVRNQVPADFIIEADRDHLFRAVLNLLVNALDAVKTREDGAATVTAWREDKSILIDIADNGPGLPEAVLGHLFQPFAPSAKGGAGLGLAIAGELIRGHGGTLKLIATGENGTRFRIVLPD